MVKLVSVRQTRLYGPRQVRGRYEYVNAIVYICATILLLLGFVLLLVRSSPLIPFIILIIALASIVLVNLHDLYSQVSGFDFRLPLFTYDPQFTLIEIAVPLFQIMGGIFFLIGAIMIFQGRRGRHSLDSRGEAHDAVPFLMAGAVLWLFGSINNAFQVFERTTLRAQALQKAVSLPFLIASTLLLISSLLVFENWRGFVNSKTYNITTGFAIAAAVLMLIAAIVNAVRVGELQDIDRRGAYLDQERREQARRPFLEPGMGSADVESEFVPYKEAVIR